MDNYQPFINVLTDNIKSQAEYFLTDAQEFYPFGASINYRNEVIPVSVYFGEDHPDSNDVIAQLAPTLNEGLQKGKYKMAALGLDVYNTDANGVKSAALEIRIMHMEGQLATFHIPYYIDKTDKVIFKEMITVKG